MTLTQESDDATAQLHIPNCPLGQISQTVKFLTQDVKRTSDRKLSASSKCANKNFKVCRPSLIKSGFFLQRVSKSAKDGGATYATYSNTVITSYDTGTSSGPQRRVGLIKREENIL